MDSPSLHQNYYTNINYGGGGSFCAGITDVSPLRSLELDGMQKVFDIDYFVPILMLKGMAEMKEKSGSKDDMPLVIVSSLAGHFASRGMISYCGAKAALIDSAKCLVREYAGLGIRINTVSPSDIETPMTQTGDIKGFVEERLSSYPFGLGQPLDVAEMIVYLLSDKAKFLSGQDYIIDSGGVF